MLVTDRPNVNNCAKYIFLGETFDNNPILCYQPTSRGLNKADI